ncbi:MAG: plasmid stabilization protein [Hoeflea sp.]|uniref:FitA-like ribbon-helix-helix domain-containing protein n=1 Tax=Hoeflea sp. TaxID=1940281 RepID=UPI003298FA25|tara:strand:+ start:1742 stop:2023 length:282 start_codon:yes stop_codon:yes gene_type:complete
MATLTIRNLDDTVKQALRERAARHGVSMEEEARVLLRRSVHASNGQESEKPSGETFYDRVMALREKYGTFDLETPPRTEIAGERTVFDWSEDK